MDSILSFIIPNVLNKTDELLESILQTLYMMFISGFIAFSMGLIIGVVLVITREGGLDENKYVFNFLDKVINIFRSIPFVILLAALIPFSRFLMG